MKYIKEGTCIRIQLEKTYKNQSIQQFFIDYKISTKVQNAYIQNKKILLNGKPIQKDTILQENDELTILIEEEGIDYACAKTSAAIVYEDAFVMIVHKDAGYIIHDDKQTTTSLNNMVATYQKDNQINQPVRPIHRLDKETSGLVLYSKIPFFQPWFDAQLEMHRIQRKYLAIVKGRCEIDKTWTIHAPIGRDRHVNGKYRISKTGKDAITHIKCLNTKDGYSLLECTLETGRTHQIRVHLSSQGYPIINDAFYGVKDQNFESMCLWANEMIYRNPITKKRHKIYDISNPMFRRLLP